MQLWGASRGANVALEHRMQQLERLSRRECGFGASLRGTMRQTVLLPGALQAIPSYVTFPARFGNDGKLGNW